ncbi:MAG: hypothetical protein H7Y17_03810 [Chlorobia bacterium]|nr:hypothetical protein [Fimbriimonadaceae bacterium]
MRKRWLWIGVAATVLILAVFALIPPGPDGLDFIRKYGPKSERLTSSVWFAAGRSTTSWQREFVFDAYPVDLQRELGPIWIRSGARKKERYVHSWSGPPPDNAPLRIWTLTVYLKKDPPWLLQQWFALSNRIRTSPTNSP